MQKNLIYTSTGKYLNIDLRQMASILRTDLVRWGFEVSEGFRPADAIVPHKATPSVRVIKDLSLMRRPIVLPIGTIISAMPVMSQAFYQSGLSLASGSAPVPVSGETTANSLAAGEIALGMGHDGSTLLKCPIDDQVEGYGKINLAAIVANGGTGVNDKYHAYDYAGTGFTDEKVRYDEEGNAISSSSVFVRPANMPIGVVTSDIFLDDTGASLNFTTNSFMRFDSFMTDYYVEVPYIVRELDATALAAGTGTWRDTCGAAYAAAIDLGMPLMFVDTLSSLAAGIGAWVKPEINGKYLLDVTSGSAASAKTVQHVGRLTSIDNKFPKDLEDMVMVVPDSGVGGTDTYGLPFRLFALVNAILKNGTSPIAAPTYDQIVGVINAGYVGIARINLHVS